MRLTGTILLVEDSAEDVERLLGCFQQVGVANRVKVCRSGYEALHYLFGGYADAPALLITELHMPNTDGFELLSKTKGHCHTHGMAAVVLTRSPHYEDLKKAYELGADHCFTKPATMEGLATLVREFCTSWLVAPKSRVRARCRVEPARVAA